MFSYNVVYDHGVICIMLLGKMFIFTPDADGQESEFDGKLL
jgi:hypothetical protein